MKYQKMPVEAFQYLIDPTPTWFQKIIDEKTICAESGDWIVLDTDIDSDFRIFQNADFQKIYHKYRNETRCISALISELKSYLKNYDENERHGFGTFKSPARLSLERALIEYERN